MTGYSVRDIKNAFDATTYSRGMSYARAGRVVKFTRSADGALDGQVKGSGKRPYRVQVVPLAGKNGQVAFDATCSCPVMHACKHAAAVLIRALEAEPQSEGQEGLQRIIAMAKSGDRAAINSALEAMFGGLIRVHEMPVAAAPFEQQPRLPWEITQWIDGLEKLQSASREEKADTVYKRVFYVLDAPCDRGAFFLRMEVYNISKAGAMTQARHSMTLDEALQHNPPKYLREEDLRIMRLAKLITLNTYGSYYRRGDAVPIPNHPDTLSLLNQLLASGRCHWKSPLTGRALSQGEPRQGRIGWQMTESGDQRVHAVVEGTASAVVLPLAPPHYVDVRDSLIGVLETGIDAKLATHLLKAPKIERHMLESVTKMMEKKAANLDPAAIPKAITQRHVEHMPATCCLRLTSAELRLSEHGRSGNNAIAEIQRIAVAELSLDYSGKRVRIDDSMPEHISLFKDNETLVFPRDRAAEGRARQVLRQCGFHMQLRDLQQISQMVPEYFRPLYTFGQAKHDFYKEEAFQRDWIHFVNTVAPRLRSEGWVVDIDRDFPYNVVLADEDWYAEVSEGSGIDWFGVELGVSVEGRRQNLMPILLNLLETTANPEAFAAADPKSLLLVPLEDGRQLGLPKSRAHALLRILHGLYSFGQLDGSGNLKMCGLDAALLAEMEAAGAALNMRWFGGEKLRALGRRLCTLAEMEPVIPPPSFHGALRPYQQQGLNWLQFLREYELAGILADDMGLGKTVQALAHIATEKAAGRLEEPALVIAPTSLMANWRMEAARFAPDLRVLTLHGPERKAHFGNIMAHDLVLTTYPLLPRDKDALLACRYHTIILDEAQTIKNSRAKITQIVSQLHAKHRLCMTGTPLENHLGELWSLFNFLLPGYLGDEKQFRTLFRNPIEKGGDHARAQALSRRVNPFILRRTKQEVATELPPKTEMLRMVELDGAQRDLYETIRVGMHEKVRKAIAARGFDKSHIIVLDALLKLRQACCDPQLVKLDAARKVQQSAKLNELMDMLPAMIEEGRKVLLFSQFTSMLAIIEKSLKAKNIAYALLTGDTQDRDTPVRAFQEGKVPLFLISLKAGGVGLNLTAADTVIHYDPWWNPAVENQATDRAYRIGQNKPVFVYKLVTQGTVEEKILEMQQKKKTLADSLLDPKAKSVEKFSAVDIQALFEPLSASATSVSAPGMETNRTTARQKPRKPATA